MYFLLCVTYKMLFSPYDLPIPSSATFLEKKITSCFVQDLHKFWLSSFKNDKKLKPLYILAKADDSAFGGREIPMSVHLKTGNDQLPQQNDLQVSPKHWRTSKSSLQEGSSPYPLLSTPLVLFKAVAVLVLDVHGVILSHA